MKKVIEEQKEIFQDNYLSTVTQNDLAKMKYLECCVKEALRLYPSVPMIGRYLFNHLYRYYLIHMILIMSKFILFLTVMLKKIV